MGFAGGDVELRGLSKSGIVTRVISDTQFESAQLAGMGDGFFQSWQVYVVRKATGTGASPQGDAPFCSVYSSQYGRFTHTAFTTPLSEGDEVYLIHPYIGSNTITTVYPSDNIKDEDVVEVQTAALVYTKVKELEFTGVQGGARISFELRVDVAGGLASAVIYKNGVPVPTIVAPFYTVFTDNTGTYVACSQDVYGLKAGDLVQVYAMANAAPRIAYVRNFQIGYDIITFPSVALAMDAVYIDTVNGTPGNLWPMGSPGYAVNNLTDALIIAGWRNTNKFHVKNVMLADQNITDKIFIGDGDQGTSAVDLNGFDANNSSFKDIGVLGSSPGWIYCQNCFVSGAFNNPAIFAQVCGRFLDCMIGSLIAIPGGDEIQLNNCTFNGAYSLSVSGGGYIQVIGGHGQLVLINSDDAACYTSITAADVVVVLAASNILGYCGILNAITVVYQTTAFPAFLVEDYATFNRGKSITVSVAITSAANAGNVVLATCYYGTLVIESIILRAVGAAPADLTHIAVYANAGNINTLIDPGLGIQPNLDNAGDQVSAVGPWALAGGANITATLTGTGATAVAIYAYITYKVMYARSRLYGAALAP